MGCAPSVIPLRPALPFAILELKPAEIVEDCRLIGSSSVSKYMLSPLAALPVSVTRAHTGEIRAIEREQDVSLVQRFEPC